MSYYDENLFTFFKILKKRKHIVSFIIINLSIILTLSSCSQNMGLILLDKNIDSTIIDDDFEDPDVVINDWDLSNDAFIHPDGYIELTDNTSHHKGTVYNKTQRLNSGNVYIDLLVKTGPDPAGADGFALTIADVPSIAAMEDYISNALSGAGLGYGLSASYSVNAIHIEFDTYINSPFDSGLGANHIAITENGDYQNHLLSQSVILEDNIWHEIHIEIVESNITVKMDGIEIINNTISGFHFQGGYIMFSASTGAMKNYHSIDNLVVYQ